MKNSVKNPFVQNDEVGTGGILSELLSFPQWKNNYKIQYNFLIILWLGKCRISNQMPKIFVGKFSFQNLNSIVELRKNRKYPPSKTDFFFENE